MTERKDPTLSYRKTAFGIFVCLALLAGMWAYAIALTGGFTLELGGTRISSRGAQHAGLGAMFIGALAWLLAPAGRRWRTVHARIVSLLDPPMRVGMAHAGTLAAVLATLVGVLGFTKGVFVAGGSDSYGYVSQAHMLASGALHIEQPVTTMFDWPFARDAFAPLGYRPRTAGSGLVPGYAPGFPLVMAGFERLLGARAVFWVVPLLGALTIWATYRLGVRLAGPSTGIIAALLVATSPIFLLQALSPMSDVPATAWWTLSLVLIMGEGRVAALAAGLCAGAAVLTRPNLAPLVLVNVTVIVWQSVESRTVKRQAVEQLALFSAGPLCCCTAVAWVNHQWYGSPLMSGYGQLTTLFGWRYFWPNVRRYSLWLVDTQTPLILAAAAPLFLSADSGRPIQRSVLYAIVCFVVGTLVAYLFIAPFEDWSFLRFLLPAFPSLFVLTAAGLVRLLSPFSSMARRMALVGVVAFLTLHGVTYARSHGVFGMREATKQYQAIGAFVGERLPDNAVVFAVQHSGSVRYYSGRLTIRYDAIPPAALDEVISDLRRAGYAPFFAVEDWEREIIRSRFGPYSRAAALDWPPLTTVDNNSRASVYDLDHLTHVAGAEDR